MKASKTSTPICVAWPEYCRRRARPLNRISQWIRQHAQRWRAHARLDEGGSYHYSGLAPTNSYARFVGSKNLSTASSVLHLGSRIDKRSATKRDRFARSIEQFSNGDCEARIALQPEAAQTSRISFGEVTAERHASILSSQRSSENREYFPVGLLASHGIISTTGICAYTTRRSGTWRLIASRLHLVWIATVCGKLETRLSLLQHSRLEHLPRSDAHRQEQGRPDPLRRGHPAGARGAFPGDDRRPLRPRRHARRPARSA